LVDAYETLSKSKVKYDNWRQYGHPDGVLALKVVELMMPTFMMDPSMQPMLLTSGFMCIVAIILFTTLKLRSTSFNLANGISVNTKLNMKDYLAAVFEDNDQQQRTKGFQENDLIALYETSENAQNQIS
jgi:hypothetical protein